MNKVTFRKFLARDGGCWHCGREDETLIPQHRRNRGLGGSRNLDTPSNVIVLCSEFNGLIESDSKAQTFAIKTGIKLRAGVDPRFSPVFDRRDGLWYELDDEYGRKVWQGFEPRYV